MSGQVKSTASLAFGIASFALSFLTWLGITPDMVGERVYGALFVALPLVAFASGFIAGIGARGLGASLRQRKACAEMERAAIRDAAGAFKTHASPKAKMAAKALRGRGGSVDASRGLAMAFSSVGSMPGGRHLFAFSELGADKVRIELEEYTGKAIDADPGLLDGLSRDEYEEVASVIERDALAVEEREATGT